MVDAGVVEEQDEAALMGAISNNDAPQQRR
jgi:hypothetical protein